MAEIGLLQAAGAPPTKQTKYVPLAVRLFFTGLYTQRNPMLMPGSRGDQRFYGGRPDALIDGLNTEISSKNTIIRRPGFSQYTTGLFANGVNSFYTFRKSNTNLYTIADAPDAVYSVTPTSITSLFTKTTTNQTFFQSVGNWVFMGNGLDAKKWNGTVTEEWGIAPPLTAPTYTMSFGASTTFQVLGWSYGYCFNNSVTEHVSTMSPASGNTGPSTNFQVGLSGVGSGDPQVDGIQIYRTVDGGATYFYLSTIPNPGAGVLWQFPDSGNADTVLNQYQAAPRALSNNPPPAGIVNLTFHNGCIWGSVDNLVYHSGGPDVSTGSGNESWSPSDYIRFPADVIRMVSYPNGLFVFTTDDIWVIQGNVSPTGAALVGGTPYYPIMFQAGIGVLNYNAIDLYGSSVYIFTSDRRVLVINPSAGLIDLGFAVGGEFANVDPTKASLTFHADGYHDQVLFICDGVGNMWRCNPAMMPEGGACWSTRATIKTGASLIDSIETSPGRFSLIIAAGNKMLFRDWNTYSDNGIAYDAFAVFGSIVLAQAGQLANVESVSIEAAISSVPIISILPSEIFGKFEVLSSGITDPPQLKESKSVFSNRYYLNQTGLPTIMRHMQLKVSFGVVAVANELYSYSIYGAVTSE